MTPPVSPLNFSHDSYHLVLSCSTVLVADFPSCTYVGNGGWAPLPDWTLDMEQCKPCMLQTLLSEGLSNCKCIAITSSYWSLLAVESDTNKETLLCLSLLEIHLGPTAAVACVRTLMCSTSWHPPLAFRPGSWALSWTILLLCIAA